MSLLPRGTGRTELSETGLEAFGYLDLDFPSFNSSTFPLNHPETGKLEAWLFPRKECSPPSPGRLKLLNSLLRFQEVKCAVHLNLSCLTPPLPISGGSMIVESFGASGNPVGPCHFWSLYGVLLGVHWSVLHLGTFRGIRSAGLWLLVSDFLNTFSLGVRKEEQRRAI